MQYSLDNWDGIHEEHKKKNQKLESVLPEEELSESAILERDTLERKRGRRNKKSRVHGKFDETMKELQDLEKVQKCLLSIAEGRLHNGGDDIPEQGKRALE